MDAEFIIMFIRGGFVHSLAKWPWPPHFLQVRYWHCLMLWPYSSQL